MVSASSVPWQSGLRQYLCFCTRSCVSIGTFVLANLAHHADAARFQVLAHEALDLVVARMWLDEHLCVCVYALLILRDDAVDFSQYIYSILGGVT